MGCEAVVFDFDGLIIDTETVTMEVVREAFERCGAPFDTALWRTFVGTLDHPHWTDLIESAGGHIADREALMSWKRDEGLRRSIAMPLQPGVLELLDELAANQMRAAIASTSPMSWVGTLIEAHGLSAAFDVIATGDQVARGKPAPDVYLHACSMLGVAPSAAIAIEDSILGTRAAVAAGMPVVAVPSALTRGGDFSEADRVVDSLCEVGVELLHSLASGSKPFR
jgi:putative hydrolase of the HAD superfamily